MASSNEIVQIEQIDKQLNSLNSSITNTATNYLKLVKAIAENNVVIKEQATTFENVAKAQKQTQDSSVQLDALSKQLAQTEAKLKALEDGRMETLIKNRIEIQKTTKEITNKVKAEQAEAGSLAAMRVKLSELTAAYDKSGTRTKAAAEEINKLSREIGKAEAATNRHQRGVGGYADQLGKLGDTASSLPGPLGSAASGAAGLGKQLLVLAASPIILIITGIVLALTALYKAFTSTDEGATAFAGVLKSVGNVVDVLIDRTWSFFKLLGSIATFDYEGIKKNGSEAFIGIGKAIKDATSAGWDYEQQMDRIKDTEAASLVRQAKLKKEIQELTVASKDRGLGSIEQIRLAELAMSKAIELNGIEVGFQKDKTEQDAKNLASKIQNDNLSLESKKSLLDEWLNIDDKELASATAKNAAFAKFYNENEDEFQALQKARSEDIDKETELVTSTRRLQTSLFTFKEQLRAEDKAAKDKAAAEDKKILDEKIALAAKDRDADKKTLDDFRTLQAQKRVIAEAALKNIGNLETDKLKKYAEDKQAEADIDQKFADAELAEIKKKAEKIRDIQIEMAYEAVNGIFDLGSAKRDEELSALDKERQTKLSNEKLTAAQKAKINEEYDKKEAAIKTKQAKADKLQAAFNIAMNTAMGVMKATAEFPLTGGMPFTAWVIAAGALQMALVAAQPIPKFKDGTMSAPEKGIFGEAGRELMFLRDNSVMMADKPTYFEGNKFKGAKIFSNPETERMMGLTEHSAGGRMMNDDRILQGLNKVEQAILSKPVAIYDREYKPIGQAYSNHQEIYLNKLTRNN